MAKKNYKVMFTTGFEMTIKLNQLELRDLIHKYKVCGYELVEI